MNNLHIEQYIFNHERGHRFELNRDDKNLVIVIYNKNNVRIHAIEKAKFFEIEWYGNFIREHYLLNGTGEKLVSELRKLLEEKLKAYRETEEDLFYSLVPTIIKDSRINVSAYEVSVDGKTMPVTGLQCVRTENAFDVCLVFGKKVQQSIGALFTLGKFTEMLTDSAKELGVLPTNRLVAKGVLNDLVATLLEILRKFETVNERPSTPEPNGDFKRKDNDDFTPPPAPKRIKNSPNEFFN
jgi:hypothetical protein